MAGQSSADFRDWDIEAETSIEGRDAAGRPFYLYRESADDRLKLGRPRYCCITPINGVLNFSFFDPSANVRPTGAANAAAVAAVLTALAIFVSEWMTERSPRPYHFDTSAPPFMVLVGAFLAGSFAAGLVGVPWYAAVTLVRWSTGRFKDDGHVTHLPLASLDGFQMLNAGDAGAFVDGKRATSGHGLSAVFDDGTQVILTGNAWDYRSITQQHRNMTLAFRGRRDEMLMAWAELQKPKAPIKDTDPSPSSSSGVPLTLDA